MIGTISIEYNAKNPNMPLWPLRAYVNSPSSLRLRNVPKKIGQWEITSVQVNVNYPDKTLKTAQCVLVGGVWVGTIEGSSATGSYTNGYTVLANGTDENGNPVSGYVLGRGDVEILKEDGTPIADDPTHFVTDDELDSAISSKAEISDVDDVANDLVDLSNSLSDYYTKNETSSATEIQNAFDSYVTSAQVEPSESLQGYADRSVKTLRVVKEVGTAVDESTYLATIYGDNDKQTDAVIRAQTYDSFFLSSYNGETFDPPIELKYGYCTRVHRIITIGGKDRMSYVTINSNAWYAQLERTFHLIKAEFNRPYYWPVESMYLSATSYPVTYNALKTAVETVNGQSGVIACSRATHYPTETAWPLAYRDEVSAKADLSALNAVESSLSNYYTKNETSSATEIQTALNNVSVDLSEYYTKSETSSNAEISTALNLKQDKLTDIQLSALDDIANEYLTIVKYDDNTTSAYTIVGTLSKSNISAENKEIVDVKAGKLVTSIGNYAFEDCTYLTSFTMQDSVTDVNQYAFRYCNNLANLEFSNNISSIESDSFAGCTSLTNIALPEKLVELGSNVFTGSTGITEVVVPKSIASIGATPFFGCTSLTSVTFVGKTLAQVQAIPLYPWGLNTSIIKTYNVASQEWVLEQLSALEARIAALENN